MDVDQILLLSFCSLQLLLLLGCLLHWTSFSISMSSHITLSLASLSIHIDKSIIYLFVYWQYWALNSGSHAYKVDTLSLELSLFCVGYIWDRVLWTICPSCFQTTILLISAPWVARVTVVGTTAQPILYLFIY
jgi:hypothetical protein